MLDIAKLSNALTSVANVSVHKNANAFTTPNEAPVEDQELQALVGDANTYPLSWSSQFRPADGSVPVADQLSPVQGDDVFLSGLFDGARFQDKRGEWWDIESYEFEAGVTIRKSWYPREVFVVSVQDIRNSIHSWIEPFLQRVPPAPAGITYGVIRTKSVD